MESLFSSASGKKLKVSKGSLEKTSSLIHDSSKFSNIANSNTEAETQGVDNLDYSEIIKDPILRTKESSEFEFKSPIFFTTPKTNDFSKIRPTQPKTQTVTQLNNQDSLEDSVSESKILKAIESNRKKYKSKTVQKNYDFNDYPDEFGGSKCLPFYTDTFNIEHILDRSRSITDNSAIPAKIKLEITDLEMYKTKFYKDKRIHTDAQKYNSESGLNIFNILEFSCKFINIETMTEVVLNTYKSTEITRDWVKHHLRMISFNVLSYARMFPILRINAFNGETVRQILEARIVTELVKCKKSSLKKLFEGDEPATRAVVLFVCFISKENSVQFSDGWYAVRAKLDEALTDMVINKEIKPGDKFMFSNSVLVKPSSEGVDPLNSDECYLKVAYNSCKRVRWDEKLGFRKFVYWRSNPSFVLENGGIIPLIKVMVAKRMPNLYFVSKDKKAFYNQKGFDRFLNKQKNGSSLKSTDITSQFAVRVFDFNTKEYNELFIVIWRMTDELLDIFEKGKAVYISNLKVNTHFKTGLQLSTTFNTAFKPTASPPDFVNKMKRKPKYMNFSGIKYQKAKFIDLIGLAFYANHNGFFLMDFQTTEIIFVDVNESEEIIYFSDLEKAHSKTLPFVLIAENLQTNTYNEKFNLLTLNSINLTTFKILNNKTSKLKEKGYLEAIEDIKKTEVGEYHQNQCKTRINNMLNYSKDNDKTINTLRIKDTNIQFCGFDATSMSYKILLDNLKISVTENKFQHIFTLLGKVNGGKSFDYWGKDLKGLKCSCKSKACKSLLDIGVHDFVGEFIKNEGWKSEKHGCRIEISNEKEYLENIFFINKKIHPYIWRNYIDRENYIYKTLPLSMKEVNILGKLKGL